MLTVGRVALLPAPPAATEVTGTLASSFGALTATAVGTRTVNGVCASSLGGLTATAVGTKTVVGALVSAFGGLTATMAGGRLVGGVLVSSFGGLTAAMVGNIGGVGTIAAQARPVVTFANATTVRTFNA